LSSGKEYENYTHTSQTKQIRDGTMGGRQEGIEVASSNQFRQYTLILNSYEETGRLLNFGGTGTHILKIYFITKGKEVP
jgi:hypothetical protein